MKYKDADFITERKENLNIFLHQEHKLDLELFHTPIRKEIKQNKNPEKNKVWIDWLPRQQELFTETSSALDQGSWGLFGKGLNSYVWLCAGHKLVNLSYYKGVAWQGTQLW